jgi:alpha-galactosidase
VTHPGGKQLVHDAIASVATGGFDLVKLDFLTDGAMEGQHYDPTVSTGIQAFNQAMAYVDSLLPASVFVSESIAPIFPSQYAHSRRISTDVVGELDDAECPTWPHFGSTEYMLNSLSFAWWMQGNLYAFNDPDGMALLAFEPDATATYPESWAQTRASASAIAGTMFFDTTDPTNATGAARELAYLTNAGVNAIATAGRAFRPLDGNVGYVSAPTCDTEGDTNSGAAASQVFVRDDGSTQTIAAFNYSGTQPATIEIDLTRLGLSATTVYTITDVWSGTNTATVTGTLELVLSPGQSTIVRIAT